MCLELGLGLGLSVDVVLSCSGVGLSLGTNLISQGKDLVLEHPVLGLKLGLELGMELGLGMKLCLGLDVGLVAGHDRGLKRTAVGGRCRVDGASGRREVVGTQAEWCRMM